MFILCIYIMSYDRSFEDKTEEGDDRGAILSSGGLIERVTF